MAQTHKKCLFEKRSPFLWSGSNVHTVVCEISLRSIIGYRTFTAIIPPNVTSLRANNKNRQILPSCDIFVEMFFVSTTPSSHKYSS